MIRMKKTDAFRLLWMAIFLISKWSSVESNWLYLAISGPSEPLPQFKGMIYTHSSRIDRSYGQQCDNLTVLNKDQRFVCYRHPYVMPSVGYGARSAIVECQFQFKYERWNCTTKKTDNDTEVDVFGATLREANKEAAFLTAITSAGVVHSVTHACAAGNLSYCSCVSTFPKSPEHERRRYILQGFGTKKETHDTNSSDTTSQWRWSGCSHDVAFGVEFAKQFLDRAEKEAFRRTGDTRHLMNLQNQNVGREAITRYMKVNCRCHGVSGSCALKSCWRSMAKFSEVGDIVKSWYDQNHVQVARRSKKRLRRKEKRDRRDPVRPNELVYLNPSPNYCVANDKLGIMGTKGRECNQTSIGSDSCDLLCCGRGYNTRIEEKTELCGCKFVWCCHVKCKNCTTLEEVHTCK